MNDNQKWEIIHGDALRVLESFAPGTFDAIITDPPAPAGGEDQVHHAEIQQHGRESAAAL